MVLIDDDNNPDSQGDNDDIIEPGENVEIIPLLNNVSNNQYDNVEGELFSLSPEIDIWHVRSGASGMVYAHYPYNVVSGNQHLVNALQTNIMPEQDFVLTYNYLETFSFPLVMHITADVPKYNNMEMHWSKEFIMNSTYPTVGLQDILPQEFFLFNYPNPFNPSTTIEFDIPNSQYVKLQILDVNGCLVTTLFDGFKEAGYWSIAWNGSNYSTGIYFYRLEYGDHHISSKMLLMK